MTTVEVESTRMEALREGVRASLPEARSSIGDATLRERCVEAWALSLSQTEFERIEDIPPTGTPTSPYLKAPLTQADHMRGTATIAIGMVDGLEEVAGKTRIDRDLVIASALLHDVGKAWEVSPRNLARWRADPATTGNPSSATRAYGAHICLTVGLPETVAHTAGYHSGGGEGASIQRQHGEHDRLPRRSRLLEDGRTGGPARGGDVRSDRTMTGSASIAARPTWTADPCCSACTRERASDLGGPTDRPEARAYATPLDDGRATSASQSTSLTFGGAGNEEIDRPWASRSRRWRP